MRYGQDAREFVWSFYRAGVPRDEAVRKIRRLYPTFTAKTYAKWADDGGWEGRRALLDAKAREFGELAEGTPLALLVDLTEIRKKVKADIDEKTADGKELAQLVYAYSNVSKQLIDVLTKLGSSKDPQKVAMEVLVAAFEAVLLELQTIPGVKVVLKKNADAVGKVVEKTAEKFGRN